MLKLKYYLLTLLLLIVLLFLPNYSNAAVETNKTIYSNNGSMEFYITGLTLDTTVEYEYALTKTQAEAESTWFLITEYADDHATIDLQTTNSDFREIINTTDYAFLTIRNKSTTEVTLNKHEIDITIPYLMITNFSVLENGTELDSYESDSINVPLRNADSSTSYYQYEKITDQTIIDEYLNIKESNGDYNDLSHLLSTNAPTANWKPWEYWNGFSSDGMNGFGYPERQISAPDSGLYYMWINFSGDNIKNLYGYILVDNLNSTISLGSVSLPSIQSVELGDTLKLAVSFNPSNATNKIVTWSSSDESVATVDNNGTVTPLKVGSTIITVTSQDGNHTDTCTVTVIESNSNNGNSSGNNSNNGSDSKEDPTTSNNILPDAGLGIALLVSLSIIVIIGIISKSQYNKLKIVK